jgi:pepF/M3 family oligoendopeptidase
MTEGKLPHWDMTVVYPDLESKEFEEGFESALNEIDGLVELFDDHGIEKREKLPLDQATVEAFEAVVNRYNTVLEGIQTTNAYIQSFITTDSYNTQAQAKWSTMQEKHVQLTLLSTRFSAWVGSLDVEGLIELSPIAKDHAYMLRKAKVQSEHLMSPVEEALAAELGLTGGSAWSKLYGNYSSQIMVPIELEGEAKTLPMTAVRNLAMHPDRDVRERAFTAEVEAWENAAVPIAAAINSIKGVVNSLGKRRKWGSPLDIALFNSNIDSQTLDSMMEAAWESFPDFRRYLKAKAKVLGVPSLAWFDMFAPVGGEGRTWAYAEANEFIVEHFSAYSSHLSGLAQRAFEENWIDAEPRDGKRGGAFCMSLRGDESRILANYVPSFDGVSTLAHELGHAYHNVQRAPRKYLQRSTPMTLAETASIFCETIIKDAAIEVLEPDDQFMILEGSLQGACQVVVDITSRFIFEKGLFDQRIERELSIDELNELMMDAQKETYADGLDNEQLHPYMWAVKPHYYSTGLSFYNYPYMFGLLFSLGLYAQYLDNPEGFKKGYDDLLSSTGLDGAAELAAGFGIDIREADFWRSSLDIVREDIEKFESLVDERVG